MTDLKGTILASLDELLSTGEVLLKNIKIADKDSGDGAMEAITVMGMQLLSSFGHEHPAAAQLFPAMDAIKSRIDAANYVGAIWETENLIKALKEIRGLVENMKG